MSEEKRHVTLLVYLLSCIASALISSLITSYMASHHEPRACQDEALNIGGSVLPHSCPSDTVGVLQGDILFCQCNRKK